MEQRQVGQLISSAALSRVAVGYSFGSVLNIASGWKRGDACGRPIYKAAVHLRAATMGGACTTPQEVEYEVVLHTYNACTGPAQAFLGLLGGGGAYVSGIEVDGAEYSFDDRGCHRTEPSKPASNAAGSEKEKRVLGTATMTPARLKKIIRSVQREFKPAKEHPAQRTPYTYDLVSHNGNHFSTALALALGVDPPPPSLNALANTANMAANLLGSLAGQFGGAMGQASANMQTPDAIAVPMNTSVPVAQGIS